MRLSTRTVRQLSLAIFTSDPRNSYIPPALFHQFVVVTTCFFHSLIQIFNGYWYLLSCASHLDKFYIKFYIKYLECLQGEVCKHSKYL